MNRAWWIVIGLGVLAIGGTMTAIKINNQVAALPKGKGAYRKRLLSAITGIVIHHSASDTGTIVNIANWHISRGWPGIGYHFVISADGTINQTNEIDTISYHVGNYNMSNIGICLIGNFSNHLPTSKQLESLKELIQHVNTLVGKKLIVRGHRDLMATECPGKMFDIREFQK
jgi:N-acetylmuramoyl-L-alanine amidase